MRELLTIRVCVDEKGIVNTELAAGDRIELGELAKALANVRWSIRSTIKDVEQNMECGGVFALEVLKHFNRLLQNGPAAESTIIQEVAGDE